MTERRPVYTGLPSLAEGIKQRSIIYSYVGYIFWFMKEETPRAYFRQLIGVTKIVLFYFYFFIYRMEVY
jgi:hypothetical protein